ncbi:MAG: hypothetical protein WCR21_00125 [Bacteroidota bacterium]
MNAISNLKETSSFQEWANFMKELSGHKDSSRPFLVKAKSSDQIISNLERDLLKAQTPEAVQLILVKKQLSFDFPIAA